LKPEGFEDPRLKVGFAADNALAAICTSGILYTALAPLFISI
jgi:hypothetical protein